MPAFAKTELHQICQRIGVQADYLAAFAEAGWVEVPQTEVETRLTAAAAANEVFAALFFYAATRSAADYDAFVAQARLEAPKLFESYDVTILRQADQSPALLLVEHFNGLDSVLCLFPGQAMPEVEARRRDLQPILPTLSTNIREYSQIQTLDNVEIRTSWIEIYPPTGATAIAAAPQAILVSLTLPQTIRH